MTPESIALWQEKLFPLLTALREHVTIEQLKQLRDEAGEDGDTPIAVVTTIRALYEVRLEVERL